MKNTMILLQAMEGVDTRFVEQAKPGKAKKRATFFSAVVTAACVALLISVLTPVAKPISPSIQIPTEPILQESRLAARLEYEDFYGLGCGFHQYWLYDISDLKASNIQGIAQLPVYQNMWICDGAGVPPQMTDAQKEALIQRIESYIAPLDPNAEYYVDDGHYVQVKLSKSLLLPTGYRYDSWKADYDQAVRAAEYMLNTYKNVLGMKDPVAFVHGGTRNLYGEQTYAIHFIEANATAPQLLVNENFNSVSFTYDAGGNISGMFVDTEDLTQIQGVYDLITPEEAKERLSQGYFLGLPELVKDRDVEIVRLTYWNNEMSEYYIPYYECVVEAPESYCFKNDIGLKTYGIYYVPAIDLDAYCKLTGAKITQ